MMSLRPYTSTIIISATTFTILFTGLILIYLYVRRSRCRRQSEIIVTDKNVIDSSPTSLSPNRFVFPLTKLPHTTTNSFASQYSINEIPPNYKTFEFSKRNRHADSSDSSYTTSTYRQSQPQAFAFGTVKSKFQQAHAQESIYSEQTSIFPSEPDDADAHSSAPVGPSPEYSLIEIFLIELVYKLHYSHHENELVFQLVRLTPMQSLIEQCFPSFLCQIRLFNNDEKQKTKKFLSRKNPIDEVFRFDVNHIDLEKSYLKLNIFGQQKNDKRVELGQTVLVINQHHHIINRTGELRSLPTSEQHKKSIQIYEDRIDMIIRQQNQSENETRALVCLVYENDRCLLHVGLIKILGMQYLLKQPPSHFHHRDQIQVKISTLIGGKVTTKRKSKLIPITKGVCTFSTSFHLDYVSLHKTSTRITICYRRSLVSAHSKPLSMLEFGSTEVKDQQCFQHWTDALSTPNRPHVQWHTLKPMVTSHED